MRRLDKATGDESGAGRSRTGGEQRRCGGDRLPGFPARRMALLRQPAGRVRRRRRQGGKLRAPAGDGGQPRAVDELRRRPRSRPQVSRPRQGACRERQRSRAGLARHDRSLDRRRHRPLPENPRGHGGRMAARPAGRQARPAPCLQLRRRRGPAAHRRAPVRRQPGQPLRPRDVCLRPRGVQSPRRGREDRARRARDRPARSLGASRRCPLPGSARQDARGRGLPRIGVRHLGRLQLLHVHPQLVASRAVPDRPRPRRRGVGAVRQARMGRVEGVLRGPDQRRLAAGAARIARRRCRRPLGRRGANT